MTDQTCSKATPSREAINLSLQHQAMHTLPDASQVRLVCTGGALWVTLDGQLEDVVLNPCDEFTTPLRTRAVVYALQPSGLYVAPKAEAVPVLAPRRSAWSRLSQSLARAMNRYTARSPNQASAASAIWY